MELNVKSLRIGNWLQGNIGYCMGSYFDGSGAGHIHGFVQVNGITETGINPYFFNGAYVKEMRDMHSLSVLEPIQLTEYILLKCGFKKDNEKKQYYLDFENQWNKFKLTWIEKMYFKTIDQDENLDKQGLNHIKNLHQLQNLYYELTSKELEIKL